MGTTTAVAPFAPKTEEAAPSREGNMTSSHGGVHVVDGFDILAGVLVLLSAVAVFKMIMKPGRVNVTSNKGKND